MARAAAAEAGAIREAATLRFSDEEIACYALPGQPLHRPGPRAARGDPQARALDTEADASSWPRRTAASPSAWMKAATRPRRPSSAPRPARAETEERLRHLSEKDAERIKTEQEAKSRGMLEAEAATAGSRRPQRRAEEARPLPSARTGPRRQGRLRRAGSEERRKKAEKAKKAAEQQPK
jgi:hypothetical protein